MTTDDYVDANWCPDCGEMRGICDCDDDDWFGFWDDYDASDLRDFCECGQVADDNCGYCGQPLCFRCFETGAGFCNGDHTDEQIAEYGKSIGMMDVTTRMICPRCNREIEVSAAPGLSACPACENDITIPAADNAD